MNLIANHDNARTIAARMNGDRKGFVYRTSLLLTTPAVVVTNPFRTGFLAIIVNKSECGSEGDVDECMSHALNEENRIAVIIPPNIRLNAGKG
jgi:hypothetical protein